jgi:hypothetical protein
VPAGEGDDTDDQRDQDHVAERVGQRRHHFGRRPRGVVGDELEEQGRAERRGAERGDRAVHPEPAVERAGAGANQQVEPEDGEGVEGDVADVGR